MLPVLLNQTDHQHIHKNPLLALHLTSSTQFALSQHIPLKSILLLIFYLCLILPSGLFFDDLVLIPGNNTAQALES